MNSEQILHNRALYKNAFSRKVFENDLPPEYHPSQQSVFPLPYFLVPLSSRFSKMAYSKEYACFLKEHFFQNINREEFYPFFIHPTSVQAFRSWVSEDLEFVPAEESRFLATPTSSFRTLLVWNKVSLVPFFVKVSILRNIASGSRHIDWNSAVGQYESSEAFQDCLPQDGKLRNFRDRGAFGLKGDEAMQLPEGLEIFIGPKNIEAFGTVIREVPKELLKGQSRIYSFVALTSQERKSKPLLLEISEISGLPYKIFLREKLIIPLMNYLSILIFDQGIVLEPHCQNTLVELDSLGNFTGRFFYRDFDLTFYDRARFPFRHPDHWDIYLKDRPDRITLEKNRDGRDSITKLFFHHFLANLVSPCLALGVSENVLTKSEAMEIIESLSHEVSGRLRSAYPLCNEKYLAADQRALPGMDFLAEVHFSELPGKFSLLQKIPELTGYIAIPLHSPLSEKGEYYLSENNTVVFCVDGQVQCLWTCPRGAQEA